VIDTPGILDHPIEDRNLIIKEMLTYCSSSTCMEFAWFLLMETNCVILLRNSLSSLFINMFMS
ncbi:hypothetical protein NPIL_438141, partial [Nephila pilipes]